MTKIENLYPQQIWYAYLNWVKKEKGMGEWEKRKFDSRIEDKFNWRQKKEFDEAKIGLSLSPWKEEVEKLFSIGYSVVEMDNLYYFEK